MDSMDMTGPVPTPLGKKFRTLGIGVLAAATLSIPVVSTMAVSATVAGRSPAKGGKISPDSHRLAGGSLRPESLRLT